MKSQECKNIECLKCGNFKYCDYAQSCTDVTLDEVKQFTHKELESLGLQFGEKFIHRDAYNYVLNKFK